MPSPSTLILALFGASVAVAQTPASITGPAAACETAGAFYEACEQLTDGFEGLPFTSQASCLCYGWIQTSAWEPSIFDQNIASCAGYLSTAHSADYTSLASLFGASATAVPTAPCKAAGNIASASASDADGAAQFSSYVASAESASPGAFSTAAPTGSQTPGVIAPLSPAASGSSAAAAAGSSSVPASLSSGGGAPSVVTPASTAASAASSAKAGGAAGAVVPNGGLLAGAVGVLALL